MKPLFNMKIGASLEEVSLLRQTARRKLKELRLPSGVIDDFQLIIAELLANIVNHSVKKPSFIELNVGISGLLLSIEIKDDASPFKEIIKKLEHALSLEFDFEKDSGRGLNLVSKLIINPQYEVKKYNTFYGWVSLSPRRAKLLLVEDDENLRNLYTNLFSRDKIVYSAATIGEALSVIKNERLDIIVTDFHLQDKTAIDLLEKLEENSDLALVPTIVYTGNNDPVIHARVLELGAEKVLVKPISIHNLTKNIELTLSRSARHRASLFHYFAQSVDNILKKKIPDSHPTLKFALAEGTAEIGGGDIVAFYQQEKFTRLIFSDIMGHGVSATAASIAFAAVLRTLQHAIHANIKPGDFMNVFSRIMREDEALTEIMATLVIVDIYDDGKIEYSSAGHPPLFIIENSKIRGLNFGGPLPALIQDNVYETYTEMLNKNEKLVIYSDGIDPKGLTSAGQIPKWFQKLIKDTHSFSIEESIKIINSTVSKNAGVNPLDDWTVLLVERK